MQAIILAAGEGMRLRPITNEIPKSLVSVKGVPILVRTLQALPKEIDSIVIVVGYKGDQIRRSIGESFEGRPIIYVVQKELKGTADALWTAKNIISTEEFLVLNGDDLYIREDLEALVKSKLAMGVAPYRPEMRILFSPFTVDSKGYLAVPEKAEAIVPETAPYINTGAYVLDKRIFSYEPVLISNGEYGLPQTLFTFAKINPVKAVEMPSWMPLNTLEDLKYIESRVV